MKAIAATVIVFFLASFASAETNEVDLDLDLEESGRFGFLDLTNNGATMTFNSTSLQYAVVSGIILLLVALVVVPLLGFDLSTLFASSRGAFDTTGYPYDANQAYSSYSNYAKRSLDVLSPVLKALSDAYQKYQ